MGLVEYCLGLDYLKVIELQLGCKIKFESSPFYTARGITTCAKLFELAIYWYVAWIHVTKIVYVSQEYWNWIKKRFQLIQWTNFCKRFHLYDIEVEQTSCGLLSHHQYERLGLTNNIRGNK